MSEMESIIGIVSTGRVHPADGILFKRREIVEARDLNANFHRVSVRLLQ